MRRNVLIIDKTERVQLGDIVKDSITGFSGVAVGITTWLHGCRRVSVQPMGVQEDGKPIEPAVFDEPQIVVVKPKQHPTTSSTGGPGPVAAKRRDVVR